MKHKSVLEQAIHEMDYQILNREVEIEILNGKMNPLKVQTLSEDNKRKLHDLNGAIEEYYQAIMVYTAELEYFKHKKQLLEKRR